MLLCTATAAADHVNDVLLAAGPSSGDAMVAKGDRIYMKLIVDACIE